MCVTESLSFDEYWHSASHLDKRPVRNGSIRMIVGDNIYHWDAASQIWLQADSHHSNPDGTPNVHNIANDTSADRVLLSRHFFYFGRQAPLVPTELIEAIGYRNGRNYRVFDQSNCSEVLDWLQEAFAESANRVVADPFDFESGSRRYSARDNKVT
jgi:hypothetical protein